MDYPEAVMPRSIELVLQDGESLASLRRFKQKVQQEDVIKEIKRTSFHLGPGEKRRTEDALGASVPGGAATSRTKALSWGL